METAAMTNTMVVQECYGYFGTGNIPGLLNNLSDDVQWNQPGPKEIPWSGVYEGREAVARFFSIIEKEIEFLKFEPTEFIEQGNKVVTLGHMEGKSKRTGKISVTDWAMVFILKNGKITRFQEYSDTFGAVQAFS